MTTNCTIPYDELTAVIRGIVALSRQDWGSRLVAGHIEAAQLRQLDRVESMLADSLRRDGLSMEAAQQSSNEFVRQVVASLRASAA